MTPNHELIALATLVANRQGVPVDLFKGLIETESAWNPGARSKVGAVGLTQVMPSTARGLGWDGSSDLYDPMTNLTLGARYLKQMLTIFNGDWGKAAAAYNHGPGVPGPGSKGTWPGVRGKIAKAGGDWDKAQALLPTETRLYWRKVLNWAGAWSGRISRSEALISSKAGELSAVVSDWVRSSSGRSTALVLLCAVAAGVLIMGGRR